MSKLLPLSRSKYRAVISEMLPYERPVFFSNRFFARFLKFYGVVIRDGQLVATRHEDETPGLSLFLQILSGERTANRPCFQYSITKDGHKDGRKLSVVHPYHQVQMMEFYDRYKKLIIEFCQKSNFSIRYPYKVATFKKTTKGYHKLYSDDGEKEDVSESIRNYFVYRHYKNINYFYDDYRFLRAEKKFLEMKKMDLEKCFESVDRKSLAKALFDCEMEQCNGSLAYEFYKMQDDFQNSDKGIVIGPEFSRLYAEMILQNVDCNVEKRMSEKGYERNREYIFYRYVDDGFLFYNSEEVQEDFMEIYIYCLNEYGQTINKEKEIIYETRPFTDPITVAKTLMLQLIDKRFENRLETFKGFLRLQDEDSDTPTKIDYKKFINELRSILRSCGVSSSKEQNTNEDAVRLKEVAVRFHGSVCYKDITSFLLGIIQTRLMKLLNVFNELYSQYVKADKDGYINERGKKIKNRFEREFIDYTSEITEIVFYLLGCDARMTTSVKVISILSRLQLFVRGKYEIDDDLYSKKFPHYYVSRLDEKISDEFTTLLNNTIPCDTNLMELLNMLEVEKIMKPSDRISPGVLNDFLKKGKFTWNFFTAFEVVHFVKAADDAYDELRQTLYSWIESKLITLQDKQNSSTEAVLTFIEAMSCPWIDYSKKKKFAKLLFDEENAKIICRFAERQKNLFIQWQDYKLNESLLQMNSAEVY